MSAAGDDAALLARIAGGDRMAFEALLERHLEAVVRFAERYAANRADAEDVAQETFLSVWRRAEAWQERGFTARSWLYRIAYTRCVDVLRRRRPHLSLHGDGEAERVCDPGADPLRQTADHARLEALLEALGRLPERQYTALDLCAWEGLSNREAAAVMGIGVEALESLLARARRALRAHLAAEHTE